MVLSESFALLVDAMGVKLDFNWLDKHIHEVEQGEGDVHVFFASEKEDFIMLDLYFGSSDHSGMVVLGAHVDISRKDEIKTIMMSIYDEACAKWGIKFQEWHNDELKHAIDISKYPRRQETYLQNIFYHEA